MENDHRWSTASDDLVSMGRRDIVTKAQIEAEHREWRESTRRKPASPSAFRPRTANRWAISASTSCPIRPGGRSGANISGRDCWGGGYGTDALLLLVDYAFDTLDVRRLFLITMTLNERVLRQMEKVGFLLEGRMRQATVADGVQRGVVIYGLLAEE